MSDVDILLVEDNHGDVNLIRRAFEDHDLPGRLHDVQTGEAAMDWLYRRDEYADAPPTDLVLLDLNLPATSGHDVLQQIKSDPALRRIPVIVLTGSQSYDDLTGVYDGHANACMTKPVEPDAFSDLVRRFVEFWVTTATLPPVPDPADVG